LALGAACLLGLFLPALPPLSFQQVRYEEGWQTSRNHLKHIGLAVHDYHDTYHHLPPAVVTGTDGRPLYSWRVLLLPFLEHRDLYEQFRLDEPWDGPHNRPLLAKMPGVYRGRWDGPADGTPYQAFVGPGTAFERAGLTLGDFPDGLAHTLLVAEASQPVPWTKPVDLAYAPGRPVPALGGLFKKPVRGWDGSIVREEAGFTACFADGSTRFIRSQTDVKTLRALITRNGGDEVDLSKLD
jgi:hypothetical protein